MSAQRQTYVDEHGRVCTGACGDYLTWGFFATCGNGRRRAKCKKCRRAADNEPNPFRHCQRCGDHTIRKRKFCTTCGLITIAQNDGVSYLVVRDPHPLSPFRGGIIHELSFDKTLEMGHFDAGIVLEKRVMGELTGERYKVMGEHFSKQEIVRINGR